MSKNRFLFPFFLSNLGYDHRCRRKNGSIINGFTQFVNVLDLSMVAHIVRLNKAGAIICFLALVDVGKDDIDRTIAINDIKGNVVRVIHTRSFTKNVRKVVFPNTVVFTANVGDGVAEGSIYVLVVKPQVSILRRAFKGPSISTLVIPELFL